MIHVNAIAEAGRASAGKKNKRTRKSACVRSKPTLVRTFRESQLNAATPYATMEPKNVYFEYKNHITRNN